MGDRVEGETEREVDDGTNVGDEDDGDDDDDDDGLPVGERAGVLRVGDRVEVDDDDGTNVGDEDDGDGDDDGLPVGERAGVLRVGDRVKGEVDDDDGTIVGSTVDDFVNLVGACDGKRAVREGMSVGTRVGRFTPLADSTVRYTAKFVTSHILLPCE